MTTAHDSAPATDRRRDPRTAVDIPASLSLQGMTVPGRLANISARGVCFVTRDFAIRVAEANYVEILFRLPAAEGGHEVRRFVRITRVEHADVDGAPGRRMGVSWDDPSAGA